MHFDTFLQGRKILTKELDKLCRKFDESSFLESSLNLLNLCQRPWKQLNNGWANSNRLSISVLFYIPAKSGLWFCTSFHSSILGSDLLSTISIQSYVLCLYWSLFQCPVFDLVFDLVFGLGFGLWFLALVLSLVWSLVQSLVRSLVRSLARFLDRSLVQSLVQFGSVFGSVFGLVFGSPFGYVFG